MKIEIEIPDDHIANALCSGFERGVGYWARHMVPQISDARLAKCLAGATFRNEPLQVDDFFLAYFYPMYGGRLSLVEERHDGAQINHVIDGEALATGLRLMANPNVCPSHHLADLISGHTDATTGDRLIQLCALGELRYG